MRSEHIFALILVLVAVVTVGSLHVDGADRNRVRNYFAFAQLRNACFAFECNHFCVCQLKRDMRRWRQSDK